MFLKYIYSQVLSTALFPWLFTETLTYKFNLMGVFFIYNLKKKKNMFPSSYLSLVTKAPKTRCSLSLLTCGSSRFLTTLACCHSGKPLGKPPEETDSWSVTGTVILCG